MRIGVLALQGAFAEHISKLKQINAGGESTAMRKLLGDLSLYEPLKEIIQNGLPVFGTCAGMILLAKEIEGEEPCFGTLDITVKRNAYGRQLGSFRCVDEFAGKEIEMPFIRAPYAERVGEGVNVLSRIKGKIVAVQQDNQLATAFHPELTNDTSVYEYFIKMVENRR